MSFTMIVLMGFVGLAVAWGYAYYTTQKLQNAADAAALAGAQAVWDDHDEARSRAMDFSSSNEAGGDAVLLDENASNDPDGDIVTGVYDAATRQFTPSEEVGVANAVLINAKRTTGSPNGALTLPWGGLFGVGSTQFSRWAIAVCERDPIGPGIILLKSSGVGLQHSGEGDVTVNGSVQINSTYKEALHQSGSYGVLSATSYEVVGKIYDTNGSGLPGDWNEGATPVPDPYAGVPVPVLSEHPVRRTSKYAPSGRGPHTLEPGRYIGGMDLGNGANYTFKPGIYIIEGGGVKISTTPPARVVMDQVMIYNTGTNDTLNNADQFYISSDAIVTWTPYQEAPYAGFGLFQNRLLSDKKVQISGNGSTNISAIIYAKSAEVQLSGNGTTTMLGGGFVAASMQISGNGDFTVGGDENTTAGGDKVYLVE
jgi:hypothetical protein